MGLDERNAYPHTPCLECIFAVWSDNKQTGCELERIEKFQQLYNVDYVHDEDNDKYYYLINGVCNACCPKEYEEKVPNIKEHIYEIIKIKCDIIVYCEDSSDTIEKITETINLINEQEIVPSKIIFIIKSLNYIHVHEHITSILNQNIKFDIVKIVDKTKSMLDCVDIAFNRCHNTYYILLESGKYVSKELILTLNNILNNQLRPFSMIIDRNNLTHCLVIQNKVHKIFRGNHVIPIYEKIDTAQETQLENGVISHNLVLDLEEELCNYQK